MEQERKEKNKDMIIFVNKAKIPVVEDKLSGAEIIQKAGLDVNQYDLFHVRGQTSTKIESDHQIEIQNGLHFNAILKSVPYG